jgi:asparagine synthase (glutamine-hydrolysing)
MLASGISALLPASVWATIRKLRDRGAPPERPWLSFSAVRQEFVQAQNVEERLRQRGIDFFQRPTPDTRAMRYEIFLSNDFRCDIERGYEALFGVQFRDPTADLRLAEFCLSIPEDRYFRDGVSRRLIRDAMAERLPPEVLSNPLRGLQAADWFERVVGAQDRLVEEVERFERSELIRSVLDVPRLRRLVKSISRPGNDPARILRDYRSCLEYAIMTGRFLLWFESGDRSLPIAAKSTAGQ